MKKIICVFLCILCLFVSACDSTDNKNDLDYNDDYRPRWSMEVVGLQINLYNIENGEKAVEYEYKTTSANERNSDVWKLDKQKTYYFAVTYNQYGYGAGYFFDPQKLVLIHDNSLLDITYAGYNTQCVYTVKCVQSEVDADIELQIGGYVAVFTVRFVDAEADAPSE